MLKEPITATERTLPANAIAAKVRQRANLVRADTAADPDRPGTSAAAGQLQASTVLFDLAVTRLLRSTIKLLYARPG